MRHDRIVLPRPLIITRFVGLIRLIEQMRIAFPDPTTDPVSVEIGLSIAAFRCSEPLRLIEAG
jgi:hypothetical protein